MKRYFSIWKRLKTTMCSAKFIAFACFYLSATNALCLEQSGLVSSRILNVMKKANANVSYDYRGTSDLSIIYITDAHCNYLAQKEIARIIEYISQQTIPLVIATEGSQGRVSPFLLSTFPIESTKKNVAENLLKDGYISGEEYFFITNKNSPPIVGVDDKSLYKKNVSQFKQFVNLYPACSELIENIDNNIVELKQLYYGKISVEDVGHLEEVPDLIEPKYVPDYKHKKW